MGGFTFRGQVNPAKALQKIKGFTSDPNVYQIDMRLGSWNSKFRFLPSADCEDVPEGFVDVMTHRFKDANDREHTQVCLHSIHQKCPICDYVRPLWDAGRKEEYRAYKSNTMSMCNIGVLDSPKADTIGKVYLLNFGWAIKERILKALQPPEGVKREAFNPFDYMTGADFYYVVGKKGTNNTYDESHFSDSCSALSMEMAQNFDSQLLPLLPRFQERTKNVKTFDELASFFYQTTGIICPGWTPTTSAVVDGFANQQQMQFGQQPPQQFAQPQAPVQFAQPQATQPQVQPQTQAPPAVQQPRVAPVSQPPQVQPQAQVAPQATQPQAQQQSANPAPQGSEEFWKNY